MNQKQSFELSLLQRKTVAYLANKTEPFYPFWLPKHAEACFLDLVKMGVFEPVIAQPIDIFMCRYKFTDAFKSSSQYPNHEPKTISNSNDSTFKLR